MRQPVTLELIEYQFLVKNLDQMIRLLREHGPKDFAPDLDKLKEGLETVLVSVEHRLNATKESQQIDLALLQLRSHLGVDKDG